jgi:hypothetical protein
VPIAAQWSCLSVGVDKRRQDGLTRAPDMVGGRDRKASVRQLISRPILDYETRAGGLCKISVDPRIVKITKLLGDHIGRPRPATAHPCDGLAQVAEVRQIAVHGLDRSARVWRVAAG